MRPFTYLAATLLCGISLFCSVALWYSEQPTLIGSLIFGGFAAGLEICKFIFFPFAARSKGLSKFGLNLFGSLLVIFSIFATVAFLETGANVTIDSAKNTSFEYQAQLRTIKNIESKIQINMEAKAQAVRNSYRKEGRDYDLILDNLESDKQKALVILKDMTAISKNGTHSLFDSIAAILNIDLVTTRQISYLIIAIFVDLGGIRCLMILTNKETKLEIKDPYDTLDVTNVTKQIATKKTNVTKRKKPTVTSETKSCNQRNETLKPCNELETMKRNITNNHYGNHPTMKGCITGTMRHPVVSQAFKELMEEGVLVKEGRKYKLLSTDNVLQLI